MATILILILSLTLTAASGAEVSPSDGPYASSSTFYDILKSNGLPIGLFPKGISDFSVDPATGRFELHLLYPSQCDAKFETNVRYQCNITGNVGYGKIANLSGVAAQELFLWLPVKGIQVDIPSSGLIYFDVGLVYKQFSLSFFETPKDCDATKGDDEGDDVVVFLDDRSRDRPEVVETRSGKFPRKSFTNEEPRAVS
ncbi:hypothetical protein CDL12_04080 [Handroanthus impetiginosus]|uniref:DUF538 domain-containing protein n=1 Tax=Handroanthus impetiginosus TaxID=429701 RepID=A0A2G9I0D5_9LAMI|nr:hypothetical protein CDL12_04080 [Handroanthus impetiginosus]